MHVLKIFSEIFHYPPKNILFSVYGLNIAEKYSLKYAQHTVYAVYEIKYKFYQKNVFASGGILIKFGMYLSRFLW